MDASTMAVTQIDDIIEATAKIFDVAPGDIVGPRGSSVVCRARDVAYVVARQLTGLSYPVLGDVFGGRNHVTILRGERAALNSEKMLVAIGQVLRELGEGSGRVPLRVMLPIALYDELHQAAEARGLVPDRIVADALRSFLPRMLSVEDWRLA